MIKWSRVVVVSGWWWVGGQRYWDWIGYYIQIMSKKPQKIENPKGKTQPVDQQNEPFLRALQKRVRNINKKLTEIAELDSKDNLKPEQIEKINRKQALLEERNKLDENASFFKEVYAENAAYYRINQLRELDILARNITLYHLAPHIPEHPRLTALWKALAHPEHPLTLNAAATSLADLLKDIANDRKLQKNLANYIQKHGNDQIKVEQAPPAVVTQPVQQKQEVQQVKVQEPAAKVEAVAQPVPQAPVVQTQPEPVVEKIAEVVPQVVVEQEATPIVQTLPNSQDQPAGQKKPERRNRDNRDNKDRPYRPKTNNNNNNNNNYNRETKQADQKRQYKPKFQEKKTQQQPAAQSDRSDSSEETRQFRRDEIKKLEDDGFIVVGKPKPKPKDSREQQRNHEKQHGKKSHLHHQASNH